MRAMRVGVVGLGSISRFYLSAIEQLPWAFLAGVCDVRDSALNGIKDVPTYRDHRTMFTDCALDAVVVTVPNDTHAPVCRDALEANLPVCVEKPLSTSLSEGHELARLALDRGLTLFTAFHRRYNDNVLALFREIAGPEQVHSIRIRYLERIEDHIGQDTWYLDPDRCGGGCLADNGPNAFDLARLFVGELDITSARIIRDDQGTDRSATVGLRSRSGAQATVELDWSYPGEIKDIEVRLTDGTVGRADMLNGHPRFKASLWHEYAGVLEEFGRLVRGASITRCVDGGVAALDLVDAAYHAERAYQPSQQEFVEPQPNTESP